ncbi:NAD-dependent epimerase/dehydratase family protein [Marinilabilia rubra]|uniref:NAD-dependent dehydratase n=1 Tax=Marinilabilia rubra TaxID=2162893 RepID=A0A2U2BBC4_9BACT|nr:NAD-dependent epimerase/dehydratase family protein [Marinilabilia rubra]PWE00361.1 NAD-dependent dehydratase [Marinilabilia rubra]
MININQKLTGKKVLVIGGGGFIGSFVVEELLKYPVEEVVVYDNFVRSSEDNIGKSLRDSRCRIFEFGGDIRDLDILDRAVEGTDYVVHLAAMWLLHCRDFPRTAFDVNIAGTFNVLEACARHSVKRLVYSSSASVYGDAVSVPMGEDHPFNNRNFYGATKISGEAMCRAFYDRFGLNYVGLRYMNVFGPRQDQNAVYSGVVPIMLNKIAAGEAPVINGDGTQAYDFVYVRDVARANVLALVAETSDEFFNVGTGVQTSVAELCDTILKLKESDLQVEFRPYSDDDSRQLVKNRIGDTRKSSELLDFSAEYTLEEGLEELVLWRLEEGIDKK